MFYKKFVGLLLFVGVICEMNFKKVEDFYFVFGGGKL